LACCAGEPVGQARARGKRGGRHWTESQARGGVRRVGLKEEEGREEKKEGKRKGRKGKKKKREKRK
jgi:hypothetical protein